MMVNGLFVGMCGLDLTYYYPAPLPENNTKLKIRDYSLTLGGPATNGAITYALMGGSATLVSCIGDSETGLIIKSILEKLNVKVIDLLDGSKELSNISAIYVNTANGDRNIFSGQNMLSADYNNEEFNKAVAECSFIEYDGSLEGIEKYFANKDVVIDAGSHKQSYLNCFKELDRLTVISAEKYHDDLENDVFKLNERYHFVNCAQTKGEKGITYFENGQLKEIAVKEVKAIDSLGAGDIIHGAYCFYRYNENLPFKKALEKASVVASYSIEVKSVIAGVKHALSKITD